PWAVLWDGKRQIAWVSTTGDNKVTGYRIDSGTPIQAATFDSIANVRYILDSPDGDILLIGADGTTQQVSAADLESAVERGVPEAEDSPVIHEDQQPTGRHRKPRPPHHNSGDCHGPHPNFPPLRPTFGLGL